MLTKLNSLIKNKDNSYINLIIFELMNDVKIKSSLISVLDATIEGLYSSLKNSFAILDEAQNATETQIKMFLTRIGENSKLVVNGDPSQVDLINKNHSGLVKSKKILKNVKNSTIPACQTIKVVISPKGL